MSGAYDDVSLTPTVPNDDACPDCGRPPITWAEVGIIVGYTALVVVLTIVAERVVAAVMS